MKKLKALQQNNEGMTMVEVLMGFLILSIILGGVVSLISFSSKMYFNSVDIRRNQSELAEEAYKSGNTGKTPVASTQSGYVQIDRDDPEAEPVVVTLSGETKQVSYKDMQLYAVTKDDVEVYVYVSTITPTPSPAP